MNEFNTTNPPELPKQDTLLCYAWDIANGKGDGEFIYCLEEDKFYHYINGYWKQIFDLEFLSHVSKSMKEITRFSLPRRKQILDNYKVRISLHSNVDSE